MLAELGDNLDRKMRGFVPLHHVGENFAFGEGADGFAELLLFFREEKNPILAPELVFVIQYDWTKFTLYLARRNTPKTPEL